MAGGSFQKKVLAIFVVIPLLSLTLGSFAATIALGAWGIVQAIASDPCGAIDRNSTGENGCNIQVSLNSQINDQPLVDQPMPWESWLGAATGVGLLCAMIITATFQALLWTVTVFSNTPAGNQTTSHTDSGTELQTIAGSTDQDDHDDQDEHDGIIAQQTITIGVGAAKTDKKKLEGPALRLLPIGGVIGLFFSCLFMISGILCLLWGIAVSYGNTQRDDVVLSSFITVELLTAILLPIFFFLSGILLAGVLDYITSGKADLRTLIPKLLPVIKFESGTRKSSTGEDEFHDYWVIEDLFYFEVKKRHHKEEDYKNKSWVAVSFDRSWATWSLNIIVCLGIHLAIAYFVDITLDVQDTIQTPGQCDTVDSTYRCFAAITLDPLTSCQAHNGTAHCFKFLRFGVDVDLISAASTSFAFFLVSSAAFNYLFTVMKILLQIKPSKWWGLGYMIIGILAFLGSIVLAVIWAIGYLAPQLNEIVHFNVINMAQLFMVCEYLFIVGLLLVAAKWWETVDVPAHKPKVKKELVRYDDTNREKVIQAANVHAEEETKATEGSSEAKASGEVKV